MAEPYDLTIIGGGPGGYVGAIRAAQLGLRVALVERDKLGGVCLHAGCIPTKALLQTAELLERVRRADQFGVLVGEVTLDYARAQARKRQVVETLHRGVEYLMRKNRIAVFSGHGRILSPTRVGISLNDGSETEVETRHILIATGSRPRALPGIPVDNVRVLDSTGALELQEVPRSMVIVGAGAIGLEFCTLFRSFGADVTVVELLPRVLPMEDEEISEAMARSLSRKGVKVHTSSKVEEVERVEGGVKVRISTPEGDRLLSADYVLVAVGREALTEGLGLEEVGVATKNGFIAVDDHMRTSVGGIFAIGDVIGGYLLAHVASEEAVLAVETIAGKDPRPIDYLTVPRCTYSIPEVAAFGMTERQAREAGYPVKVGRFSFQASSRALTLGEREGFVKVVADSQSGEILGVHMIGPSVTELVAEGVLARSAEATVFEVGASVHAHPTLSEAFKEAALDVLGRVVHA
jgi:dihydrolipoamide dehydrogenase